MKKATVNLWLDKRRLLKNDKYPLKIRITYNRESKVYGTVFSFLQDELDELYSNKNLRNDKRKTTREISMIIDKAQGILDNLRPFSFDAFENEFFVEKQDNNDIMLFLENHRNQLLSDDRIQSAETYKSTLVALKTFTKRDKLDFSRITPTFLKKFEHWMLSRDKSPTTISIYTICIRRAFNLAINSKIISKDIYPFGSEERSKYTPPKAKNIKKSLHISDIKKIYEYQPVNEAERLYRDIWLFSYFCNGMNMADIANLKYENIQGDTIIFTRLKTIKKRNLKPIMVSVTQHIIDIIENWGIKPRKTKGYLFSIISENQDLKTKKAKIKQFTKQVNKYIRRIGNNLEIEADITTYTARHTYATVLRRKGYSDAFIGESIGHSDPKTTENYFGSFEQDSLKQAAEKLTEW